jgi:D-sedoheptulose 7-phosphate isomerase
VTVAAVFLDRDGVINRYAYQADLGTVDSPANPGEFELLPGAADAIASLNRLGLAVIVVSNQPGIAKGKTTPHHLDSINAKMRERLSLSGARVDGIFECRHHPEAIVAEYRVRCDCRKPLPGLLLRAAREHGVNLGESILVGDDASDVLAGRAVGVKTVLVSPPRCTVCNELFTRGGAPDYVVRSLKDAVDLIAEVIDSPLPVATAPQQIEPCVLGAAHRGSHSAIFLREIAQIAKQLDVTNVERLAALLTSVRSRGGRLFLMGVGGGAGHASHAACDFRKIAGIEAYSVTDNVSELTAWVNDEGWETSYKNWLLASRLDRKDMVLVFSVGGGNPEAKVSVNLVCALNYAREVGCAIGGIVGRNGGYTAGLADVCVLIPTVNPSHVTPHTESFQAILWHLLVCHPALQRSEMKWESVVTNPELDSVAIHREPVQVPKTTQDALEL